MCQTRPTDGSAIRWASDSRRRGVRLCVKALPRGLSGPIGTRTKSSSSTVLVGPSTIMSSRALNRCLVERRAEARRELRGVRVAGTGVGGGENDAGGLDLEADRAVEVEVPVEAVVVVADGGEEADHHAALTAGLRRAGPEVGVLPQDAGVLLVQADRVAQDLRVALLVGEDGVQVGDVAEAVAAQLESVGVPADEVLAGVEVVLPGADAGGVGVRHDHLRDRGAVDDRPDPVAVGDADLVEGEPFPGVEPDAQLSALPDEQVALEREAR